MKNIRVEKVADRKYMIFVNDNYIGTYNKTITNIKLRAWGCDEVA